MVSVPLAAIGESIFNLSINIFPEMKKQLQSSGVLVYEFLHAIIQEKN